MLTSRQKVILIIALVIIIFFVVYFYKSPIASFVKKILQPVESPKPEIPKPKSESDLQEQMAEIVKSENFDRCQEIEDKTYQTACINNIALNLANEKQDLSFCQKLDDKLVSIETCEREIIFSKSIDKEDISVCGETKNSQLKKECEDSFWPSLALKKGDIRLCDNISDESAKENCSNQYLAKKEFSGNVSAFDCNKFQGEEIRQDCNMMKENTGEDTKICSEMKSDFFKNYCLMKARGLEAF